MRRLGRIRWSRAVKARLARWVIQQERWRLAPFADPCLPLPRQRIYAISPVDLHTHIGYQPKFPRPNSRTIRSPISLSASPCAHYSQVKTLYNALKTPKSMKKMPFSRETLDSERAP